MLVQRLGTSAGAMRLAFARQSEEWCRDDLQGARCYVAPTMAAGSLRLLDIKRFRAACIMVLPGPGDVSKLRLLPVVDKRL